MLTKYAGNCFRCHKHVQIKEGDIQRANGDWLIRCFACKGKGNQPLPLVHSGDREIQTTN